MDETPWNFIFARGQVLAEVGAEEVVCVPQHIKQKFIVLETINLAGQKFPPIFLATGKTDLCHRQFDGISQRFRDMYIVDHSTGGNTSADNMERYLDLLNE